MTEVRANINDYTVDELRAIKEDALVAALSAAENYFQEKLGGQDQYACGFAWVNIYGVKGNSKLGRNLKRIGIEQDYSRAFSIWNPSGLPVQNIDCKEAGAIAAANVFTAYGFEAYAGSRLD